MLSKGIFGSRDSSSKSIDVLDNACGGGVLTNELLKLESRGQIQLNRIVASDSDEKMLDYVRKRKEASQWPSKVEVMHIDQQEVPLPDDSFTHVFNNFGIFFCKDDEKALTETYRILRPGGTAGFTSWKVIAWWDSVARPAVKHFIPDGPELPHPGAVFPGRGWSDASAIPEKLTKAGFKEIDVSEYSFTPDVEAAEFAEAMAVLVKVITGRLWSEEDNEKFGPQIEPALLKYLETNFEGGKWDGKMLALISIGKKV